MLSVRQLLIGLFCPLLLAAQPPAPAQPADGLQPDWDVSVILGEMSAHGTRLLAMLDRLDVPAWVQKGASETYAAQLQSTKDQLRSMVAETKGLAANPEKLSSCLQVYFRIQAVEQMIGSLVEGARKYQDQTTAEALASLSAENGTNRNRFQTYIVNLAAEREQVCAVMDKEAQRCRSIVATQSPVSDTSRGRKK
jgi:hypothetical protein